MYWLRRVFVVVFIFSAVGCAGKGANFGPESSAPLRPYATELRNWGNKEFPGHDNSSIRHCVVGCIMAYERGSGIARTAGWINEIQGFFVKDLLSLPSRISGKENWSFSSEDLRDNERGFRLGRGASEIMQRPALVEYCKAGCGMHREALKRESAAKHK